MPKQKEKNVSDLIAERQANLTRSVKVKNIHRSTAFAMIPSGSCGLVTPMEAFRFRAWLKPILVEGLDANPADEKEVANAG